MLVAVEDPGDDSDVVVGGERLAELGQQVRRRLDARPVVLVEDEQAWPAGRVHAGKANVWPVRILFATPAHWPAVGFGGPIWVARELTEGLAARGHEVDVVTTSLRSIGAPPAERLRTRKRVEAGVRIHELATPLRYRWMGVTPSLPLVLRSLPRPDVVHVFGYRDFVTTVTAAWARTRSLPYVFEPLDMYVRRYRNVPLKRGFDRLLGEPVARGAELVVAVSELERAELVEAGLDRLAVVVRPNGFPRATRRARDGAAGSPRDRAGGAARPERRPRQLQEGARSAARGDGRDPGRARRDRRPGRRRRHVCPPRGPRERGRSSRAASTSCRRSTSASPASCTARRTSSSSRRGTRASGWSRPRRPPRGRRSCSPIGAASPRCSARTPRMIVPPEVEPLREAIARVLSPTPSFGRGSGAGGRDVARRVSWASVVAQQVELYRRAIESGARRDRSRRSRRGSPVRRRRRRAGRGVPRGRPRARPLARAPLLPASHLRRQAVDARPGRGDQAAPLGPPARRRREGGDLALGRRPRSRHTGSPRRPPDRAYGCWLATTLDDEWAARARGLDRGRRLAQRINALVLRRLERRLIREAARVYAISPASRAAIAAAAERDEAEIGILPIPVDVDALAPEPDETWLARLEAPTLAFVGRADDPRKNLPLLLDALPLIRARVPGTRLRLIGRPPARVPEGVDALGLVDSIAEPLRESTLFVLPSWQEGFGIVAAEALACGVPGGDDPVGRPRAARARLGRRSRPLRLRASRSSRRPSRPCSEDVATLGRMRAAGREYVVARALARPLSLPPRGRAPRRRQALRALPLHDAPDLRERVLRHRRRRARAPRSRVGAHQRLAPSSPAPARTRARGALPARFDGRAGRTSRRRCAGSRRPTRSRTSVRSTTPIA